MTTTQTPRPAQSTVTRDGHTVHLFCGCGAQVNTVEHLETLPLTAFRYWFAFPVCNRCWDAGKRPEKM